MIRIVKDLVARRRGPRAGCGYLSPQQIEAALEGRPAPSFHAHQLAGCSACALLAADIEVFHGVVTRGALETERREFAALEAPLRARLRQDLAARDAARRTRRPGVPWALAAGVAAAAVVLVVAIVPGLFRGNGPNVILLPDGTGFSIEAFSFDPPTVRGASAEELLRRAGTAYAAGEYDDAARLFGEAGELRPDDHEARLYRGVSLLMTGSHHEAVEALQRAGALAAEQGLLGAVDDWYLGLAALGANDLPLATAALERARDKGGPYGERAGELLQRLQSD